VNLRVEEVTKPLTPSLAVDHLETDMQQFDSVKSVASSDKQQLLSLLFTTVHRKDVSHDDARGRAVGPFAFM
jgi:hypothetical protein